MLRKLFVARLSTTSPRVLLNSVLCLFGRQGQASRGVRRVVRIIKVKCQLSWVVDVPFATATKRLLNKLDIGKLEFFLLAFQFG